MAVNYRKAVSELAISLIGTGLPVTDEFFMKSYAEHAAKTRTELDADAIPYNAAFVTYVMRSCGVPLRIVPNVTTAAELRDWAESKGRFHPRDEGYVPKRGDLVIFDDGSSDHVSFFIESFGTKIEFIDGARLAGGFTVLKKTRIANSDLIAGYMEPDYEAKNIKGLYNPYQLAAIMKPIRIQEFRNWLVTTYGAEFIVDYVHGTPRGTFSRGWIHVAIAAWQKEMGLDDSDPDTYPNGDFDADVCYVAADHRPVKPKARGNRVFLLQGMLYTKGYDPKGFTGVFNANTKEALQAFQKARSLPINGIADAQTWESLFRQ